MAVLTIVPLDFPSLVQVHYREVIDGRITGDPDSPSKFAPEAWAKTRTRILTDGLVLDLAEIELRKGVEAPLGNLGFYIDAE